MQTNPLQTPKRGTALTVPFLCGPCAFAHGLSLVCACIKTAGNFFPLFFAKVFVSKPAILLVFTFLFLEVFPCVN